MLYCLATVPFGWSVLIQVYLTPEWAAITVLGCVSWWTCTFWMALDGTTTTPLTDRLTDNARIYLQNSVRYGLKDNYRSQPPYYELPRRHIGHERWHILPTGYRATPPFIHTQSNHPPNMINYNPVAVKKELRAHVLPKSIRWGSPSLPRCIQLYRIPQ